ncbi:MAG: hypothetical protein KR126chlam4_01513 [Candidatus Anoxychlamydiales bacterium]|nr:hypothetical protein [Candidatus Anoxychlamydiales bacterium]
MKKYFLIIGFCILSVGSFADEDKVFDQMKKNDQKEVQKKENISAKNKNSFNYVRVGPGAFPGYAIPSYPTLGFGRRVQNNNHGYDISIDVHSELVLNWISLKGEYMFFFPKSTLSNHQYYLGSGINYMSFLFVFPASLSLEVTPGIQYKRKSGRYNFIQLDISNPIYNRLTLDYNFMKKYVPGVGLSFGFGF